MTIERSGAVLGIDVGYSKTSPTTGLCVLSWDDASISLSFARCMSLPVERDDAVTRIVAGRHLLGLAIDGPLTHNLRHVQHYRAAEALLSRGVFQRRGKPGQTSSPTGQQLHLHATAIARSVLERCPLSQSKHFEPIHEQRVVEAFPNMFLAALVPESHIPVLRRDASDRYWEILVHHTSRLVDAREHWRQRNGSAPPVVLDVASSGAWFDGWKRPPPEREPSLPKAVAPPRSFLLRRGWRRHGLVDPAETPGVPTAG